MVILNVFAEARVIGHVRLGAEYVDDFDSFLCHLYHAGQGFATGGEEVNDF